MIQPSNQFPIHKTKSRRTFFFSYENERWSKFSGRHDAHGMHWQRFLRGRGPGKRHRSQILWEAQWALCRLNKAVNTFLVTETRIFVVLKSSFWRWRDSETNDRCRSFVWWRKILRKWRPALHYIPNSCLNTIGHYNVVMPIRLRYSRREVFFRSAIDYAALRDRYWKGREHTLTTDLHILTYPHHLFAFHGIHGNHWWWFMITFFLKRTINVVLISCALYFKYFEAIWWLCVRNQMNFKLLTEILSLNSVH